MVEAMRVMRHAVAFCAEVVATTTDTVGETLAIRRETGSETASVPTKASEGRRLAMHFLITEITISVEEGARERIATTVPKEKVLPVS